VSASPGAPANPAPPLLHVNQLSVSLRVPGVRRSPPPFAPVTFTQAAGERLALLAQPDASAGASALARAVALIDKPSAGQVRLAGEDLTRAWGGRLRALRRRLQYVGPEGRRALAPYAPVQDLLAEPLQVHRLGSPAERRAHVAEAAATWQINPWLFTARVTALSGALCQRVALARACLLQPRLLVCDGLTDRLEPAAAAPLLALLADYCQTTGLACLLITTDPALAAGFATRTLRLDAAGLH
jgi:ABC-type glutathione transport system ATPase component